MSVSTRSTFARFASATARIAGRPITFAMAVALIFGWAITGPVFGFSDTWQLIINTFTTIVTFLMVFLIQNTQNRDAEAMHIKVDELIRAVKGAQNTLLDLEDLDEKELDRIRSQYEKLAREARRQLDSRTSIPKNNGRGER
jgi:low affinity Fe/Cu permease